jgi:hypothetical protein
MPSTDTKPELTANASMAQPVSQPAVYANGLTNQHVSMLCFVQKHKGKPFFCGHNILTEGV